MVEWVRNPKKRVVVLPVKDGRGGPIVVPESAAEQRRGGGLVLETHSRLFSYTTPDGKTERVRALTVFLVNRRAPVHRSMPMSATPFRRGSNSSATGFVRVSDLSGYRAQDWDLRIADLHYRDMREWAVGRNAAAGWDTSEDGAIGVTRAWTDPLPSAEVERVAPNEDAEFKARVTFGMEALAQLAEGDGAGLRAALADLPVLYGVWIDTERRNKLTGLPTRRRETGERLVAEMETAKHRIAKGIEILATDARARTAFRFMNLAVSMAARRRIAGAIGDPNALDEPQWRPFQLAFVLLNMAGLIDRTHVDRETADLLFFPTGGGKTEAYLGLAALVIAHRRLGGSGVLGAGVAVIMRYTLRLLTLDQLARAAGVVCALELMRTDAKNVDERGRRMLGDWPIEIGLWVGSDASPNKLGGKGKSDETTAVGRIRRYRNGQTSERRRR